SVWSAGGLVRAHRNYAMDYVANGLTELLAYLGDEGAALARLAARLIGRQLYRQLQRDLDTPAAGATGFARILEALAARDDLRAATSRRRSSILLVLNYPRLLS